MKSDEDLFYWIVTLIFGKKYRLLVFSAVAFVIIVGLTIWLIGLLLTADNSDALVFPLFGLAFVLIILSGPLVRKLFVLFIELRAQREDLIGFSPQNIPRQEGQEETFLFTGTTETGKCLGEDSKKFLLWDPMILTGATGGLIGLFGFNLALLYLDELPLMMNEGFIGSLLLCYFPISVVTGGFFG